jgi:hypothetical protein
MWSFRVYILIILSFFTSCQVRQSETQIDAEHLKQTHPSIEYIPGGGLLLSDFNSLDALEKEISITYSGTLRKKVRLTNQLNGIGVTSVLKSGISEKDLEKAKDGGIWKKIIMAFRSPYAAIHRKDLQRIVILARRRRVLFGEGDVAFYDLSASIQKHINPLDTAQMSNAQLSEKGYFNTFNHITAQALMTSIFSEKFADFIADIHELGTMPELTHGNFGVEQLSDWENGPTDNYLDMINNEWGQELGKSLKYKYGIEKCTEWTPALLAAYLNDIQAYYSHVFFIGFKAFRPTDEIVLRFSRKINLVMDGTVFEKQ